MAEDKNKQGLHEDTPPREQVVSGYDKIIDSAAKISTFVRLGRVQPTDIAAGTTPSQVQTYLNNLTTADRDVNLELDGILTRGVYSPPGFMVFHWAPTIGVATNAGSEINKAFRAMYSTIRHANSGARNYQAPDLTGYILATDSIYGYYMRGLVACALYDQYLDHNVYTPEPLLQGLGWNWNDLVANMPTLKTELMLKKKALKPFKVPAKFEYFKAHHLLNSAIFMDGDIEKTQWYVFMQRYFFKYATTNGDTDLEVVDVLKNNISTLQTVSDYLTMFDDLLQALNDSDDYDMISGDVEKAFGEGGTYELPDVDTYSVPFVKEAAEIMEAINNMLITPLTDIQSLVQRDYGHNYFVGQPIVNNNCVKFGQMDLLNFIDADPTPMRVYDALRFHPVVEKHYTGSTWDRTVITSCGTEIITGVHVWVTLPDGTFGYHTLGSNYVEITPYDAVENDGSTDTIVIRNNTRLTTMLRTFNWLGEISAFDWHPCFIPIITFRGLDSLSEPVGSVALRPIMDWQNIAPVKGAAAVDLVHAARIYVNFFNF